MRANEIKTNRTVVHCQTLERLGTYADVTEAEALALAATAQGRSKPSNFWSAPESSTLVDVPTSR